MANKLKGWKDDRLVKDLFYPKEQRYDFGVFIPDLNPVDFSRNSCKWNLNAVLCQQQF